MTQLQTVGAVLGAAVAALAVVAGLWKGGRVVVRLVRGLFDIIDDWKGEPARDGVPPRLGVMRRLAQQDEVLARQDTRLARLESGVQQVRSELKPNGGGSLRDAVDRVEEHLGTQQQP